MKSNKLVLVSSALFSFILIAPPVFAQDQTDTAPAASGPESSEIPPGSVEVLRAVLAKDVQEREPVEEITAAKVGDVVVGWSQIRSGVGEVTITHRWLHEDNSLGDIPLTVKSSPYRTWSRKTLADAGNWKWQILDPSGAVLKEVAFTVTAADPTPQP